MKNSSVSVGQDVYHRARIRAAEQKTSVSAIVRHFLEEVAEEKTEFERLQGLEEKTWQKLRGRQLTASNRLDREKLHQRDAFR